MRRLDDIIQISAENPDADFAGPFGGFQTDTNGIPTASNCAALAQAAALAGGGGTTASATNITNLCSGSAAFFNAGQNQAPDFVARWRIEQPWGHLHLGAVVRDITLNDGESFKVAKDTSGNNWDTTTPILSIASA